MTWFIWLGLAAVIAALAAVTGIKPKGTQHLAGTRLMGVARLVLIILAIIECAPAADGPRARRL